MNDIKEALFRLKLLYEIDMNEDDFEELALIAWNKIGNKHTRMYRYRTQVGPDLTVTLPCNCDFIEAVTYDYEDLQLSSNIHEIGDHYKTFTEQYIEHRKLFNSPEYINGRFVKFEQSGNKLYFNHNYGPINILYHGVIADEDGLPQVNEKELDAITTFCAYIYHYKKGVKTLNQGEIAIGQQLYAQWLVKCDAARTPEHIDQNSMNEILDTKNNWNRKVYGKSYKPIQ